MSIYRELRNNSPKLEIKENPKQVIFHMVSVMCDNRSRIGFKKNSDNEFQINCFGQAFSNFQIKHYKYELEWLADEENWSEVEKMLNSGTSVIEKVVSR